jgi:hypothetical protein
MASFLSYTAGLYVPRSWKLFAWEPNIWFFEHIVVVSSCAVEFSHLLAKMLQIRNAVAISVYFSWDTSWKSWREPCGWLVCCWASILSVYFLLDPRICSQWTCVCSAFVSSHTIGIAVEDVWSDISLDIVKSSFAKGGYKPAIVNDCWHPLGRQYSYCERSFSSAKHSKPTWS